MNSEQILDSIDRLVQINSDTALEFGWLANEYFEIEKPNLVSEFGTERAAFHETIAFLHDREANYVVARSTVADRMRVTRYMTREKYKDIVDETEVRPSFHQLRACMVTDKGEVLPAETDEMIEWCVMEGWPPVVTIRERRDGLAIETPEDVHWHRLVKCALAVSRDFLPSSLTGRYYCANQILEQDNSEKAMLECQ
jgi:hypothetical protein